MPTTTTPPTTPPTTTPVNITAEQINILGTDTLTLSFGNIEAQLIEPLNPSRFFVGYDYDEAVRKCGALGGHLPIIGNDNDKQAKCSKSIYRPKSVKILEDF